MMRAVGEMPEWPNGTDSKSVVLATVPRVQIPISPPVLCDKKPPMTLSHRGLFVCARFSTEWRGSQKASRAPSSIGEPAGAMPRAGTWKAVGSSLQRIWGVRLRRGCMSVKGGRLHQFHKTEINGWRGFWCVYNSPHFRRRPNGKLLDNQRVGCSRWRS